MDDDDLNAILGDLGDWERLLADLGDCERLLADLGDGERLLADLDDVCARAGEPPTAAQLLAELDRMGA